VLDGRRVLLEIEGRLDDLRLVPLRLAAVPFAVEAAVWDLEKGHASPTMDTRVSLPHVMAKTPWSGLDGPAVQRPGRPPSPGRRRAVRSRPEWSYIRASDALHSILSGNRRRRCSRLYRAGALGHARVRVASPESAGGKTWPRVSSFCSVRPRGFHLNGSCDSSMSSWQVYILRCADGTLVYGHN